VKRSVLIVGFGLSLALAGGALLAFGDETASVSVTLKTIVFRQPNRPSRQANRS
jgi:hypothetical protein